MIPTIYDEDFLTDYVTVDCEPPECPPRPVRSITVRNVRLKRQTNGQVATPAYFET